ncbi:MAG TPA: formylglycine-generating enzyme family protein [Verrucomicrobiota bacterium]|nr:formylglycine-generating enzyme family protein [Verrucomicrobiota bacterium]HNU52295.1 formylglycine-generating enzyme family protein [Verrucomicrobiota bacterium]
MLTAQTRMKLAQLPNGEFMMGSPPTEDRRWDHEGPQHLVRLSRPFWMALHPVTVGQFRAFVDAMRYRTEAERDGGGGFAWVNGDSVQDPRYTWRNVGFDQTDDEPVVNVSWNDAAAFCQWLTHVEGLRFRLPTEAEWEYACRAGTTTPFHFGSTLSSTQANFDGQYPYGEEARGPYLERTSRVGAYTPNAFGLYDMHGNVWEWCADWYAEEYYRPGEIHDPKGPPTGVGRVIRGGGWRSFGEYCRSAFRYSVDPAVSDYPYGFRVVGEE